VAEFFIFLFLRAFFLVTESSSLKCGCRGIGVIPTVTNSDVDSEASALFAHGGEEEIGAELVVGIQRGEESEVVVFGFDAGELGEELEFPAEAVVFL